MIEIPKEELLESLRLGYLEYKQSAMNANDEEDLAHVKGYCVTIEQILSGYGGVSKEEMLAIKRPIIGNVSLRRKKKGSTNGNLDEPTVFRRKSRGE